MRLGFSLGSGCAELRLGVANRAYHASALPVVWVDFADIGALDCATGCVEPMTFLQ